MENEDDDDMMTIAAQAFMRARHLLVKMPVTGTNVAKQYITMIRL